MHIHHVLMHLLALGAFSPTLLRPSPSLALMVLMHRLALGAFSPRWILLWASILVGLNAPFGARCFLTFRRVTETHSSRSGLNAPFGARCFLTREVIRSYAIDENSLNAPFGARCFLTHHRRHCQSSRRQQVLMRRLALGAF